MQSGRTHQPLACRRDKVHGTVAPAQRRAHFDADAVDAAHAGHRYVRTSASNVNAGDAYSGTNRRSQKGKGRRIRRLFLTGMIQHHKGALVMVEELFNTAGSGQDSELFNFATEVDNGQRAEIKIMESMLGERP